MAQSSHKLVIIGAGPAGYTAALYAARAQLAPVLLAGPQPGGQLMWTSEVENFPGFAEGIRGPVLMKQMKEQAEKFGAVVQQKSVTKLDLSQRPFKIWTGEVTTAEPDLIAETIIVAVGASSIMLGVPGESELLGKGVSTCAVCDAAFYPDKTVFVVGGGDSAMEDTLALTKFAKSVTVVHRRAEFKASKIMQERVLNHPKVKVMWNTEVKAVRGTDKVEQIVLSQDGKEQTLPADGVFIAIGHKPSTDFLQGQLQLDEHNYVVTRQSLSQAGVQAAQVALADNKVAFPSMTSVEGVFAAGDAVDIRYKQAVTAAGQGCSAALDAERYLEAR